MRRPKYLYLKRIFIFPTKIGSIGLLLWIFSSNLWAESYSNYSFDDFYAQNDWGRKKVETKSRTEHINKSEKNGFVSGSEIYLGGGFLAQKGGANHQFANKHAGTISGNSAILLGYSSTIHSFSIFLGPKLSANKTQIIDSHKTSVWDAEGLFGYTLISGKSKIAFEGGRAWQRLDGFGFLFNGMANYGQVQLVFADQFSLSLIHLRFKQMDEPLTPSAWNHESKRIFGGALRSKPFLFWENLQLFHYIYSEPNVSYESFNTNHANIFGNYLYSGLEFRSEKFLTDTNIDLSLIRTTGIRKMKTYPWNETESSTNSILAYGSIHGTLNEYFWAFSGFYAKKDAKERTDRESNGYAAPLGEPRIMGGYSSFLLYQSVSLPNDNIFTDYGFRKPPGFENKGMRIIGLQFGKELHWKIRTDFFLNSSSSEMGNGKEVILKITKNFDPKIMGFVSLSGCYARVNSNEKIIWVSEPFVETQKEREYIRFYLSSGFQF